MQTAYYSLIRLQNKITAVSLTNLAQLSLSSAVCGVFLVFFPFPDRINETRIANKDRELTSAPVFHKHIYTYSIDEAANLQLGSPLSYYMLKL